MKQFSGFKWLGALWDKPADNKPFSHDDRELASLLGVNPARLAAEQHVKATRLVQVCGISFALLVIWAVFAQVPRAAHGNARVIPSQRLQVIQAVDGGVITLVSVKEGQRVKANEVLLQIDTTRFDSGLREKQAQSASLELRQARLNSQLNGEPFSPPAGLVNRFKELYDQENRLLGTIEREWAAQKSIAEEQLDQRQRELEEARSQAQATLTSKELLTQELNQLRPLLKGGAVSPVEILRLEKQVAQATGDSQGAAAQVRRVSSSVQEARQKIKELELKRENETRRELTEIRAKLKGLEEGQVELSDKVAQATIKSPVPGRVQRVLYNTRGAVVPPGQPILEIVPDDDLLLFDTQIAPSDIAFIRPGQPAVIKVSAYDYSVYGALNGEVSSISADSVTNAEGQTYYQVKVSVPSTAVNPTLQLIPGMTADVSITTEYRSVLSYLLRPVLRGFSRAMTEK
ncbi:MAG: HlyD family type I secretion periplasmic adaptor subunit [Limnobacter sp.]|nr:HlyD family type I secretion periplasmic adaptor subunit [Limnobacter sp.]